jgi:hypothetical protein
MKRRYMEMTEDIKEYAPTKGNPAEPSKKKKKKKRATHSTTSEGMV